MAYISVTKRRGIDASHSRGRILDAAEKLILDGAFAQATVSELAEASGVSRATVFSQFGSKLGVLEALATRCAGGPQMEAIRAAVAIDDADTVLSALVAAVCEHWERQGHILLTLKAVAALEPGAIALLEDQRADQRECVRRVVTTLNRAGRPAGTSTLARAQLVAALHLVTSVESFIELRRNAGLSLAATRRTLTALAEALFPAAEA